MPWQGGNIRDNPDFVALLNKVRQLELKAGNNVTNIVNAASPKRYRIAVKKVTLAVLGTVNVDIVWTTPMPSEQYTMDYSCTALLGMPTVTVTNQTKTGCTLSFAPGVLAVDAILVVFAVAPMA